MVKAQSSDMMICTNVVGWSSQILKLRQYNPNIYRIEDNHKAGALAKFHTFTSHRFWGIIPQLSTQLGVLRFRKCRFCMPLTAKLSFTYPYNFPYSVFALHSIHIIFWILLLTGTLELHNAKDAKMSLCAHCPLLCLCW